MFSVDQKPEFQSLNLAREALGQLNSGTETPASGLQSVDRETAKNHLRTLIFGDMNPVVIGDTVDSGIRLSYRPASLCSLAGRYDNPESTLSPSQKESISPVMEYSFQLARNDSVNL